MSSLDFKPSLKAPICIGLSTYVVSAPITDASLFWVLCSAAALILFLFVEV